MSPNIRAISIGAVCTPLVFASPGSRRPRAATASIRNLPKIGPRRKRQACRAAPIISPIGAGPCKNKRPGFRGTFQMIRTLFPPVLDVEWNGQSKTCPKRIPRDVAIAQMKIMLAAMEQAYGKLVIYTSIDFHRDVMEGEFSDYPIWLSVKRHRVGTWQSPLAFLAAYRRRPCCRYSRLCRSQCLQRFDQRLAGLARQQKPLGAHGA